MGVRTLAIQRRFHHLFKSQDGSIAVITIGLFILLLSTALVLTDISSIYLAKRSLTQATEAAVQRAMKNLDAESYYSGEYNLTKLIANMIGSSEEDPGIPIDCDAGVRDAQELLNTWGGGEGSRFNLGHINIVDFQCDGYQIYIQTSAHAQMPVHLPFMTNDSIALSTEAGAIGERAETNNYSGFDFG